MRLTRLAVTLSDAIVRRSLPRATKLAPSPTHRWSSAMMRWTGACVVSALSLLPLSTPAQLPAGIASTVSGRALPPSEDFFKPAEYTQIRLSPDGGRLAALIPINGRSNLALVDLEHKTALALTGERDDDVLRYRWLGNRVVEVWVADIAESGGVSRIRHHVLIDVVDNVVLRDLQSISRFGEAAVLDALDNAGSDLVIETRDRNVNGYDAFHFDARSGEKRLLTFQSPGDVKRFIVDRAGQVRVAISVPRGGDRTMVSYRHDNDAPWTTLRDEPTAETTFEPIAFDFDNRTLYVHVPAADRGGRRDVLPFDTETGRFGERLFTASAVDAGEVVFDRVQRKAVGVEDGSASGVAWIDPQWDRLQRSVDTALPGAHNVLSWGRDETNRVTIRSESETSPPVFYLLDRRTMAMERVAQSYPWLREEDLSARRLVHYKARDGLTIPAYLTMPKRPDGAKPPLIVTIHGGPYVAGERFGFDPDAQFFASRGYAVLQPNFRGTLGYGDAFHRAGLRQWGLAMQDDVTDGVRWLIATGRVDGDRVCLFGASYGGYATLWGLEKEPTMFRCGIAYLAVSDLELMFDVTWSDFMRSERGDDVTNNLIRAIGDPAKDRERMRAVSPDRHADRIQAPLLLAYGGADQRVPIIHGTRMRSALDDAHKPYEWVVYDDQQHTLFSPEHRSDFYRRVEAFLAINFALDPPRNPAPPAPVAAAHP